MRPSRFTKTMLYPALVALVITGIGWLIGHYFLKIQGEFGPEQHPLETWSLRFHGLSAIFGTLCLGMLTEHHIKSYLIQRKRLWTGLSLLVAAIWLTASGYMLYYLVDETWQQNFALAHWIVGLIAVIACFLHILGKKY